MADDLLHQLARGIRATHPAEWLAVITGVFYVVLIMVRHRAGWIFGGISSAILMVLAAQAELPMNAALQFSYVVAAFYGFWSWSKQGAERAIRVWHWRGHMAALLVCATLSFGVAQLLEREGASAFPFTDSLVACIGLFATWLVARVYLENWLYWVIVDAVSVYLYFVQGLVVSSFLFVIYLTIAAIGFTTWLRRYRRQVAA